MKRSPASTINGVGLSAAAEMLLQGSNSNVVGGHVLTYFCLMKATFSRCRYASRPLSCYALINTIFASRHLFFFNLVILSMHSTITNKNIRCYHKIWPTLHISFGHCQMAAVCASFHVRNVRRILVGGSMSPCRLRRRKFWKFDYWYEIVHSEVYLNKYVVSIAPFSTPACPDCSQNIT